MIAHRNFCIKNYSNIRPYKMYKQSFLSPSATQEILLKMKRRPWLCANWEKLAILNTFFFNKYIVDPKEIYMADICK